MHSSARAVSCAGRQSPASLCHTVLRRGRGHCTESMPIRLTPRRMKGKTLTFRSTEPTRPQQVTAPPAVARYRESVWAPVAGSLREDFDAATRRHALAWKAALAPCGYPAIRH